MHHRLYKYPLRLFVYLFFICLYLQSCQGGSSDYQATKKRLEEKKKAKKPAPEKLLSAKDAVQRLKAYATENPENKAVINTEFGKITIKLYEGTPLHRANFVRLSKRGFYDETMFHRVVPGFVMQGGGTDTRKKVKVGKYRIPSEINPNKYVHRRGAVAMARYDEDNPNKESDSHEFYIVWGEDFNPQSLKATIKKYGLNLSERQRSIYLSEGGSPHLDGLYTVFGEVVDGMEAVEQVCHLKVDKRGWPLKNVSIKMEVMTDSTVATP